jgi:hypothetical protein
MGERLPRPEPASGSCAQGAKELLDGGAIRQ